MANVKITDLAAYTNPDSTDVLPIVDVGADVTKKISIADLLENAGSGTEALPGIAFDGDNNTGIYRPGADQVAISTNGTERVEFGTSEVVFNDGGENYDFRIEGDTEANLFFVDASTDRVGLGTSSSNTKLSVATSSTTDGLELAQTSSDTTNSARLFFSTSSGSNAIASSDGELRFFTGSTAGSASGDERLRIDSTGNVGINTASPGYLLTCATSANGADGISVESPSLEGLIRLRADGTDGNAIRYGGTGGSGNVLRFLSGGDTERARIDTSGRLLVGTSSSHGSVAGATANFQVEGTSFDAASASFTANVDSIYGPFLDIIKTRGTSNKAKTVVQSGDRLGTIRFLGADGTRYVQGALVEAYVDGTPGSFDMPGRLVFSTTADGASSPTERVRLTNNGALLVGTTVTPTEAGNGAVVAEDRVVVGAQGYGVNQVYAAPANNISATTGTLTFGFKCATPTAARVGLVKVTVITRSFTDTPADNAIAEYAFMLHQTSGGVCSIHSETTIFEYTFDRATDFTFANLGSGECTVTFANPKPITLTPAYKVEITAQGGVWGLDSVTST